MGKGHLEHWKQFILDSHQIAILQVLYSLVCKMHYIISSPIRLGVIPLLESGYDQRKAGCG